MNNQKETKVKRPKPLTPAKLLSQARLNKNRRVKCPGGCGTMIPKWLKIKLCRKCRRKAGRVVLKSVGKPVVIK